MLAHMQENTHWSSHDTCVVKAGKNSYLLGIFTIRDCASKAGCLEAENWLCVGQFCISQRETIN